MVFLSNHLTSNLIDDITELCVLKMLEQERVSLDKLTPAGQAKTFRETLQYVPGRAFINYNDITGSTKIASIEFDIPILNIN